jgi:hypothetical protein
MLEYEKNTNTSTLKQYNQHAITKLKHIMQAKSRKGAVKETRTEVHVASQKCQNYFFFINV